MQKEGQQVDLRIPEIPAKIGLAGITLGTDCHSRILFRIGADQMVEGSADVYLRRIITLDADIGMLPLALPLGSMAVIQLFPAQIAGVAEMRKRPVAGCSLLHVPIRCHRIQLADRQPFPCLQSALPSKRSHQPGIFFIPDNRFRGFQRRQHEDLIALLRNRFERQTAL
ncbi:hypothetical protein D3C73_579400 [compost metagenome]